MFRPSHLPWWRLAPLLHDVRHSYCPNSRGIFSELSSQWRGNRCAVRIFYYYWGKENRSLYRGLRYIEVPPYMGDTSLPIKRSPLYPIHKFDKNFLFQQWLLWAGRGAYEANCKRERRKIKENSKAGKLRKKKFQCIACIYRSKYTYNFDDERTIIEIVTWLKQRAKLRELQSSAQAFAHSMTM